MRYTPNLTGISDGSSFSSSPVTYALDELSGCVSEIDQTNFDKGRSTGFITTRSVHTGALTETVRSGTLIPGEPACWVVVGRGSLSDEYGQTTTDIYSLGPNENVYTVEGCSVRHATSRRCRVMIDSVIQVEAIKISNYLSLVEYAGVLPAARQIYAIDLHLDFELIRRVVGDGSETVLNQQTVWTRVLGAPQSGTDLTDADTLTVLGHTAAKSGQRGFTVQLCGAIDASTAVAHDYFVRLTCSIPSVVIADPGSTSGDLPGDGTAIDESVNQSVFYAHIKSLSRHTTLRAFYVRY